MENLSIAVVTYNEENRILQCLSSIKHSLNGHPAQILIIDNNSKDRTRDIAQNYLSLEGLDFNIVKLEKNNMAAARNKAIQMAKYPWLCFVDADCRVRKTWFRRVYLACLKYFPFSEVAAVGGGNKPPLSNKFYFSLRQLTKSLLGHFGSSQVRLFRQDQDVVHLSTTNIVYKKEALLSLGGFDSEYSFVGEDLEQSFRLKEAGYKMMMVSGCDVFHYHKVGFYEWFKKMYKYGWAQPRVAFKYPGSFNHYRLLPLVIFVTALFLSYLSYKFLMGILFLYLIVLSLEAFRLKRNSKDFFSIFLLFLGTHLAYGLGELASILTIFLDFFRRTSRPKNIIAKCKT